MLAALLWLFVLIGAIVAIGSPDAETAGRLNRSTDRLLVDRTTGESATVRPRHMLFFIRVEHWGIVLLALAPISFVSAILGLVGE